jgi:hypothetical protein
MPGYAEKLSWAPLPENECRVNAFDYQARGVWRLKQGFVLKMARYGVQVVNAEPNI